MKTGNGQPAKGKAKAAPTVAPTGSKPLGKGNFMSVIKVATLPKETLGIDELFTFHLAADPAIKFGDFRPPKRPRYPQEVQTSAMLC
jgi:hypothetical protein